MRWAHSVIWFYYSLYFSKNINFQSIHTDRLQTYQQRWDHNSTSNLLFFFFFTISVLKFIYLFIFLGVVSCFKFLQASLILSCFLLHPHMLQQAKRTHWHLLNLKAICYWESKQTNPFVKVQKLSDKPVQNAKHTFGIVLSEKDKSNKYE